MDKAFAALDSEIRRQILVYLSAGNLTFSQIKSRFPYSGPAVLYHLRMLEDAGFIERTGAGHSFSYALVGENLLHIFNGFLSLVYPRISKTPDPLRDSPGTQILPGALDPPAYSAT